MGLVNRDFETRVSDKAEELAKEKFQTDFTSLPPHLEMQLWMEAESLVFDQMDAEMEAEKAKVRESGVDFWGELELARRLGK